jgi:hypothetical protein
MAAQRLSRRQKHILPWLAADHQRTRGMIASSHSLRTLEIRGLIVLGRSPGGKAESVWLTSEGQKGAAQLTESCDAGKSHVAAMG